MGKAPRLYEPLREALEPLYEFRRNTITGVAEYREGQKGGFIQADRYFINSLKWKLERERDLVVSAAAIESFIESDFAESTHPVKDYFEHLPRFSDQDGDDPISQISRNVTAIGEGHELWPLYFKKWMVSVVANSLNDEKCLSHSCLVLCGPQGTRKTTFFTMLIPPSLTEYLYCGKINPEAKDSMSIVAENLIVCIDDQLDKLNHRHEDDLKELITKPKVKYRRPYEKAFSHHPHLATFCATVNGKSFITDLTGSRRFWSFEVAGINTAGIERIDMDAAWNQALFLYRDGFKYWTDEVEQREFEKINAVYRDEPLEVELIQRYFEPTSHDNHKAEATDFMSATDILNDIQSRCSVGGLNRQVIGAALARLGFKKWQKTKDNTTRWVWSVVRLSSDDVDREQKFSGDVEIDQTRVIKITA